MSWRWPSFSFFLFKSHPISTFPSGPEFHTIIYSSELEEDNQQLEGAKRLLLTPGGLNAFRSSTRRSKKTCAQPYMEW